MLRARPALPALLLALLPTLAGAAPLQITGRVLQPPRDVQVELRPFSESYEEALRRLKGEAVPPIASVRPRPDGSFALQVPESGFYSVVVRAPGHLALEGFVHFVVEDTEVPPVELPPASPLEVKALGADGKPLAGVTIQAIPQQTKEGDWRAAERRAVTDAQGRAVFPRSQGEALILTVTTPGLYGTAPASASGSPQTIRFPAPRSRTVELQGAGGKPAAGSLVRLARRGWPFGLTGEDGRIALPVPEEGEIGLFAEDSKGLRIELVMTVEAGEGTDVPVVALRSPTTVTGKVLDAVSREPIPGALVFTGGTWARAGAGGAFEVRAPSGDRGQVQANAAGRVRWVQRWSRSENAPLTILLGPAVSIAGQVVDEAGKPVEGAKVVTTTNPVDHTTRPEEKRSWTGPDGRFVLRQLPAGQRYTVMADREGFAPAHQLADGKGPVRLVLRRGTAAAGRVVDAQGLPVAGAELTLTLAEQESMRPSPLSFRAASDADGRFRFPNVSAGRFNLQAARQGFAAGFVEGVLIPERQPQVDLGEVTLLPGAALEGIVVDERGRPVEGAGVIVTSLGADGFSFRNPATQRLPVETGPDGRFRFTDLPRGKRIGINVFHQELPPVEVPGVEVPTEQPLRIQLTSPRSLEGRVTDKMGEPVAGAQVAVTENLSGQFAGAGFSWGSRGRHQAETDQDGRFVLSRLTPGTIDLEVSASGYKTGQTPGIRIPEEGQAAPVAIVLEPGTFLQGHVLDSEGLPVRNAQVQLRCEPGEGRSSHQMALADDEGLYELRDLEPGPCTVQANAGGQGPGASARVEVRPGRNRLDLRFPAGTEVSGRVVDSQGTPIPGASVTLQPLMPTTGMGFEAVSSADGSFVLQNVSDGQYRLIGASRGFASTSLPGEVRVAGAPLAGLELRLGPGATIRGRLLGLDELEGQRVRISAYSVDGIDVQGTAQAMSYQIHDLAPGQWHINAFLTSQIHAEAVVEVSPGDEEVVADLEFPAGFTLTGRVLLDRSPLPRAQIVVQSADRERPAGGQQTTAHDGTFRLERLPAGSYTLMVLLASGLGHAQALEMNGDRDVLVEIATGVVEGRLVSPDGLPVAGAAVSLTGEDPDLKTGFQGPAVRSDDQGLFELPRVAAGTYKLTVQANGFAPAESRVVVTPGGTVHVDIALRTGTEKGLRP